MFIIKVYFKTNMYTTQIKTTNYKNTYHSYTYGGLECNKIYLK